MGQTSQQVVDFSSKEVVLGLVIEQPDNCYRLGQRLEKVLRGARYGRGTAEKAVKTLADAGLIRLLAEEDADAGVYETTPAGVAHFRGWLRASTSMPPVREELHAKIALCEPPDLPLMIDVVKEAELACMAELNDANKRTRSVRKTVGEREWGRRMGIIVAAGDAAWWDGRIKWLQSVRLYLEKEWRDYRVEHASDRLG